MRKTISTLLLIIAIIHILPLAGVLGKDKLEVLYGISITDSNLLILMQHRAVLFGLLGAFVAYSAFVPKYQNLALVSAFISLISFMVLAQLQSTFSAEIQKVFMVDVLALICAVIASILKIKDNRS